MHLLWREVDTVVAQVGLSSREGSLHKGIDMDVGQARDYLFRLADLPALKGIREHTETLEEISCLLDDVESLLKHLDNMPEFEPEDSFDRNWIERTRQLLDNLKSYGDKQFLENIVKNL
jgi:hypothetical protein